MNPPTEISPSTQLLLDEIRELFDEFNRKLDESEARWERRDSESRAARAQWVAAVEPRVDIPKRNPAAQFDVVVVADNWGGLFEQPVGFLEVRDLDLSDAPVVADNWGGLFDGGNYFSTCSSSASVTPAPSAATSVVQRTTEFKQVAQQEAERSRVLFAHAEQERRATGSSLQESATADTADPARLDSSSLAPLQPQADEAEASESEAAATPFVIDEPYRDAAAGVESSSTGVDLGLQQVAKVLAPLQYHEMAPSATRLGVMASGVTWPRALTVFTDPSAYILKPYHSVLDFAYTELATAATEKLPSAFTGFCIDVAPSNTADFVPTKCLMHCRRGFTSLLTIALSNSTPTWVSAEVVHTFDKRPWPPPSQAQVLREQGCDAELRPTPWPSFYMAERNSVTSHPGRLWKPPWYVSTQQQIWCVLPAIVEPWKCLMRPRRFVVFPVPLGISLLDPEVMNASVLSKLKIVNHGRGCDRGVSNVHIIVHTSIASQPWLPPTQAPVHLKTSLSVNTMLVNSTQLYFGFWSLIWLGWVAVQYMPPWPPPQSNGTWFQLSVSFVISCSLCQSTVPFFHYVSCQECWKLWLELLQNAVQVAELNDIKLSCTWLRVYMIQLFPGKIQALTIILLHLINDRRAMLLLSVDQWGMILSRASMLKREFLVEGEHLVVTVTSNMQPLFQCCPLEVAGMHAVGVSATLLETGILQITIVRCSCHLLALVALMDEQTDFTVTYNSMNTCWDCTLISVLVFGKYLVAASLLGTNSIPSKLSTIIACSCQWVRSIG